jgi:hypothetical protein
MLSEKIKKTTTLVLFFIACTSMLGLKYFFDTQPKIRPSFPAGYGNAVWEWREPSEQTQAIIPDLAKQNIKTIYLSLHNWIYISELPRSSTKRKDEEERYIKDLEAYLATAQEHGISVQAVFGAPKWSEPDLRYLVTFSSDLVLSYNKNHPHNPFSGIQFDIEPYNKHPEYDANPVQELLWYVETVDELVTHIQNTSTTPQIRIGFVIPFWFEGEESTVPKITFLGEDKFPFYHIANRLNRLQNAYLVVMAYRNKPDGSDGSIAHSLNELQFTSTYTPRLKVLIAQEVGDVDPPKTTFYNLGFRKLHTTIDYIVKELTPHATFEGVAINDVEAYFKLQK